VLVTKTQSAVCARGSPGLPGEARVEMAARSAQGMTRRNSSHVLLELHDDDQCACGADMLVTKGKEERGLRK